MHKKFKFKKKNKSKRNPQIPSANMAPPDKDKDGAKANVQEVEDDDTKAQSSSSHSYQPLPKLPIFSGEDRHTSFENWDFEIQCLEAEGTNKVKIIAAIRRSLQGQAILTLRTLGIANVKDLQKIREKFKAVYGSTLSSQTVMSNFFQIKQKDGETAGSFAMRLENCLAQAVELKRVEEDDKEPMLKEAFKAGLNTQLKMGVDYLFSCKDKSFDQLVVLVKTKEEELGLDHKKGKINSASAVQNEQIEQLTATVAQLKTELQNLKQMKSETTQFSGPPGQYTGPPGPPGPPGHFSGPHGHYNGPPGQFGGQRQQGPRHYGHRSQGQHRHIFRPNRPPQPMQGANHDGANNAYQHAQTTPPQCWKCGQIGHLQRGCRNLN